MEPDLRFPFTIAAGATYTLPFKFETLAPGPYFKQLDVIYLTPDATVARKLEMRGSAVELAQQPF